jgi:predicted DNA-binding transcriptional regulator AlpA
MDPRSLRIVGAAEIKDLVGVSRQRVYQLAKRPDFPKPYAVLAQGQVWQVEDVEAWIAEHRDARRRRPRVGPGKDG